MIPSARKARRADAVSQTGSKLRSGSRLLSITLAGAVAISLASASPAAAKQTHRYLSTFGNELLSGPTGIAVDNSSSASAEDVYVVNGSRVTKFSAEGKELGQIETANLSACHGSEPFSSLFGVAVNPSNGDLYVADAGAGTVSAFTPAGECIFQKDVGSSPHGVAVDPSDGVGGTLYVANDGLAASKALTRPAARQSAASKEISEARSRSRSIRRVTSTSLLITGKSLSTAQKGECIDACTPIDSNAPSAVAVDPTDGHILVEEGAYTVNARTAEFEPSQVTRWQHLARGR